MPLEVGLSGLPSKRVGVYGLKLDWFALGLVTLEVNPGELMSDCKGEFSATRKSSNRISAQVNIQGFTIQEKANEI